MAQQYDRCSTSRLKEGNTSRLSAGSVLGVCFILVACGDPPAQRSAVSSGCAGKSKDSPACPSTSGVQTTETTPQNTEDSNAKAEDLKKAPTAQIAAQPAAGAAPTGQQNGGLLGTLGGIAGGLGGSAVQTGIQVLSGVLAKPAGGSSSSITVTLVQSSGSYLKKSVDVDVTANKANLTEGTDYCTVTKTFTATCVAMSGTSHYIVKGANACGMTSGYIFKAHFSPSATSASCP